MVICASPVCNPETNNVVAIELTGGSTSQNILLSPNEKSLFNNNKILSFLTNYEIEIIYFKCNGKTDKEIALILSSYYQINITAKIINHDIRGDIYYKMQVNNLNDLKTKAVELGIDKLNIDELLPKDDIIILKNT